MYLDYARVTHDWHHNRMTIIPVSFKPKKVCATLITPSSNQFLWFLQVVYPVGIPKNRTFNFWKSLITLLFFIQSLQKLECKCTLICSQSHQIWRKSAEVCISYCNFSKVCEKKNIQKNVKNMRWTLKVRISVMA